MRGRLLNKRQQIRLLFAYALRTDLRGIPDPQLEVQLGQQPFKPARMPAGFHPHAHLHSLGREIAVELLRLLAVLQSALPALASFGIHKRNLLEARMVVTTLYLVCICQICEAGFPKRNGEPFFISKYLVSRTKARTIDRLGNVLCLCPTCAAKFQHGAVEMHDPLTQILRLRTRAEGGKGDLALSFHLCGQECRIHFSDRHLIDLQELLKTLQSK